LLASLLLAFSLAASAQFSPRQFPKNAWRGTLVVTAAPGILLDGKPGRLAPGARIHSAQNLLLLSGSLQGQELLVNYSLEATSGLVLEVWILTPQEALEKRARAPD
jgi:hypothetical protein